MGFEVRLTGKPIRTIQRPLRKVARGALDLLLPPVCVACRAPLATHGALCGPCWRDVQFIVPPICDRLGTPLPFDTGERTLSAAALAAPPVYDRARSAVAFGSTVRTLVHELKYADRSHGLKLMVGWMAIAGRRDLLTEADVLVPVPMTRLRIWRRRFNQAALLARELARRSGLPWSPDLLRRRRQARPQVGLTLRERRKNVAGAIIAPKRRAGQIKGRRIVLIDDVITTGATADACANALLRSGASAVDVLTFARVLRPFTPTM